MALMAELTLVNDMSELGRVAEWLDGLLDRANAPPRVIAALQVALEEVLNNILSHAFADLEAHQINVRLAADACAGTLEIFDDGIPFDPTQPPPAPADIAADPELTGLDRLLVHRLLDEVAFERIGVRNHVTLRKLIPQ